MKRVVLLLVCLFLPATSWAFPDNGVLETFTGADTTTPPNGNWTNGWIGAAGVGIRITSNGAARVSTSTTGSAYWSASTFSSSCEAYATISAVVAGASFQVGCRLVNIGVNTTDGYSVIFSYPSTVTIHRRDNGAATPLGTTITQAISAGDGFGIRTVGSYICAWHKPASGSWTEIGCREESTYSAGGAIGIGIVGAITVAQIDNFGGGTVTLCGGGSSPTWTAPALNQTTVRDCIFAASTGDTINLPAGTGTWTTDVQNAPTIRLDKGVTLHGETSCTGTPVTCVDGTIINDGTDNDASEDPIKVTGTNARVTGISFKDPRGVADSKPEVTYSCANCRFDHNSVTQSTGQSIHGIYAYSKVDSSTLIDHNYFRNMNGSSDVDGTGAAVSVGITDGGYAGLGSWSYAMTPGDANAVYMEDNNYDHSVVLDGAYDAYAGARLVFRYNTVTNTVIGSHGLDSGSTFRSVLRQEVYRNTFTNNGATLSVSFNTRGGFHLVWDNVIGGTGSYSNPYWVQNFRSDDVSCSVCGSWDLCDGTHAWDQNTGGQEGYACLDQVGRGPQTTPGTGFLTTFTEPLLPSYGWGNLFNGATPTTGQWQIFGSQSTCCATRVTTLHILRNREFYQEAASFNGSSGTGEGTLAALPTACTAGVAYFAYDQGSWNTSTTDAAFNPHGGAGEDGVLYKCTVTGNPGTWAVYYTPYAYPHPLQAGPSTPDAPAGLRLVTQPNGNTACFVWDASTMTNLVGYRVYHGLTSGVYDATPASITIADTTRHSPPTQYCYQSPKGGTHYFSVTAFDNGTIESALGSEVSATFTAMSRSAASARGFVSTRGPLE